NGSVVHAGLLSLDVARREAKLGDVVAALSDREFRLLHHLVLHEGEVVSRERLLADVWGYHFDPRSNVVEVCIRRLRQKLGTDAPIETVRHGGYRLTAAEGRHACVGRLRRRPPRSDGSLAERGADPLPPTRAQPTAGLRLAG